MAGRKEFELLFKLKATLGGNFNSSFTNAMNTTRQLQNTLSRINATQGKIDGYKKQAQAITENRSKLAELTAEHDRLQQEMNQTENPSEALRKKFERNARQIEQTTARIEEQEARLSELGGELRDAGVDTDRLSEENDRLSQSYDRVRQSQEKLAKIADAQKKNDEAIAKTKSQLGGTIGVITAVGAAIYAGPVKNSIEFQTAMAKVGTIADSSVVPLSTMQKEILKLSSTVGVSADLIADDVYNAISAGQSTENAVGFVERAVKLAKGGFAETGQALDVLTTIINAYGLESEDAGKISDMLIQTQNKGKTTVAELSSVMGKIIPTAKSNNVALEQVCAGYAIMTSKGIAAAESTTYMNSMLNELGKTGTKADKALKQAAGAGFKDLMASGKSIAEVLDILDQSAQKSGLSLSDMFGSAEAGKAALTLMAGGVDGFNESVDGMLNSTGAAQSAFEKMADTTQNKIDKAKTALKNLSIVLGDTFLPYVTAGAEKLSDLVTKFSDWAMENPELLKTIVKVVAGLAAFRVGSLGAKLGFLQLKGGVLSVMAAFTKLKALGGIKGILGGMGGIKGLFSGIGGKLLPIVAIATAIAVAIKLISGNLEEVRGFIQRTFGDTGLAIFDKVVSVVQNIGNAIKGVFSGENISGARDFFQNTFGDAGVAVFDAVIGVVEQLKTILPGLIDQLSQGVAAILPVIVDLFKQLLPVIMNIVATVLPMVIQAIGQLLPLVMEIINTVLPVLIQLIQTLAPVISEIIQAVLPVIIQLLQTLLPIVQEIINTVLPIIIDLFNTFMPIIQQLIQAVLPVLTQLLQALVPVVQFVAELFGNVLGSALQSISAIIGNVMQIFQGLIDFITGVFTGNWSKAWEGVKSIFSGIVGGLANIFKAPINFIISGINTFLGGLNKLKIPDWVPGVGGMGFNIPLIPMLAKGSNYTPDTFIAGEAGAELITGAKGRKVFTAAQTGDIFKNLEAARSAQVQQVIITLAPALQAMLASAGAAAAAGGAAMPVQQIYSARTAPGVTAPTVAAETGTRTTTLTLQSNPVFNVNGGDPEELRGMFDEYQQDTLNKVDEMWRKKEDDERRGRYD